MNTFSGIDPTAMATMNATLSTNLTQLISHTKILIQGFTKCQVDTTDLKKILEIADWGTRQLPELRRRQQLGAALEIVKPQSGLVPVPEAVPTDATVQQAVQAAAKVEAQRMIDGSKQPPAKAGEIYHVIAGQLTLLKDDPDFTAAFYAALPDDIASHIPTFIAAGHSTTSRQDMNVFTAAFHTTVPI